MDSIKHHPDRATEPSREYVDGDAEQQQRLAREATLIAQADADIAAGRLIDEADIDAWIDSIGTDHALPQPRSR